MFTRIKETYRTLTGKNRIIINGEFAYDVSGSEVKIKGKKILVNGKVVHICGDNEETVHVKWEGDLANLDCNTVDMTGRVDGNVNSNTATVNGNVEGSVDANNVHCGNVGSYVEANIVHCKDVGGNIDAMTVNAQKVHGKIEF